MNFIILPREARQKTQHHKMSDSKPRLRVIRGVQGGSRFEPSIHIIFAIRRHYESRIAKPWMDGVVPNKLISVGVL